MTWMNDRYGLVVALCLLGCSSGSGSGSSSTSGGGSTCEAVCQAGIDKGCTSSTLQTCTQSCLDSMADEAQECVPLALGLSQCAVNQLGCDLGSGSAILSACPSQASAYTSCVACVPDPADDDACDTCSKQSCCSERKETYGDPNLVPYGECVSTCADLACIDGCNSQYPSVLATAEGLASCESTSCASACQ